MLAFSGKKFLVRWFSTNVYAGARAFLGKSNFLFGSGYAGLGHGRTIDLRPGSVCPPGHGNGSVSPQRRRCAGSVVPVGRTRAEFLVTLDDAKTSLARGEGRPITQQSMRELAEEVKKRGQPRLAGEPQTLR